MMYDPHDAAFSAVDYPVSGLMWHLTYNLAETPVSGDLTVRARLSALPKEEKK